MIDRVRWFIRRLSATLAVLGSRRGGGLGQDGASPSALEQPATVRSTAQENIEDGRLVMSANAVAGAIAGTLVSICLHPVDTIKVTIQAQRSAREPIAKVIATMLSKRGVFGLYSGLTTSLASSAPISAIYTASYESIKVKLLPMFPEVRCVSLALHLYARSRACLSGCFTFPSPTKIDVFLLETLFCLRRKKNGLRIAWRVGVPAWRLHSCTRRQSASNKDVK